MKHNKLFKSLSALALAGIMTLSSVLFVGADETQITDKTSFEMAFKNEVGVKYLSDKDTIEVVEAMYGKSVSELSGFTLNKYATVHVVDDNTVFSVDWAKSTFGEKDVKKMYISTYLWYRDASGKLQIAKCFDSEQANDEIYKVGLDLSL